MQKKWIIATRHYDAFPGALWVSLLLLKGTCHVMWVKWLWGNKRWDGCGAPWDHNVTHMHSLFNAVSAHIAMALRCTNASFNVSHGAWNSSEHGHRGRWARAGHLF